jgi:hypothetical protein
MAVCGIPWPVCPDCLGQELEVSTETGTCPDCGRTWPVEEVALCPWEARIRLRDVEGSEIVVCCSHSQHPRAERLTVVSGPTFIDFERYCAEQGVSVEEAPAAFAAWLEQETGWDLPTRLEEEGRNS